MPEKNYLNLHMLISHSPSCLNRDDMNMQKTAVFGGVRRVRISSQCLKRAMRESEYWTRLLGKPSIRTRDLDRLKDTFKETLSDPALKDYAGEAIDCVAGVGAYAEKKSAKGGRKASPKDADDASDGEGVAEEKGVAVAPWTTAEVEKVCRVLAEAKRTGRKDGDIHKKIDEALQGVRETFLLDGLDIALFGRMVTSGQMIPIDGAMSLAHVITTHAVEEDTDWFTAMDDLKDSGGASEAREDAGAGHLNTQEFGAGVFYRYASLNIRDLQRNLGDAGRAKALEVGAHFAHMLATVVPKAKQRSFAAHNPADFALASLTDFPVSAANAFEQPVQKEDGGGFMSPSVAAFERYIERVYAGYGLGEEQAVFSLRDTALKPRMKTLAELESWIRGR